MTASKSQTITLRCTCGAFRGFAKDVSPASGNRIICMCGDCQAFAHFLGRPKEILDAHGGTDIFQMIPPNLEIANGKELIRCMRLSEKGLFRWYVECCKTPIANTMGSPKIPFAGIVHNIMDQKTAGQSRDQVLGPVAARIESQNGIGECPPDATKNLPPRLVFRTIRLLFSAWLNWRKNISPLFDSGTLRPIIAPTILSAAEREKLRKLCGGK